MRRGRSISRWGLAVVVVLALTAAGCGSDDNSSNGTSASTSSSAQSDSSNNLSPVDPLSVSLTVASVDVLNWIAHYEGFFEDRGVDVSISCCPASNAPSVLASGDADIIVSATLHGLALSAQGRPTVSLFYTTDSAVSANLITRSDLKTLDDVRALDSCSIGAIVGSGSWGSAQKLNTNGDLGCKLQGFTDPAALAGSVGGGHVDAGVANASLFSSLLSSDKANLLIDSSNKKDLEKYYGDLFIGTPAMALTSTVKSKRESMIRWMKALDDAREYFEDHTDADVAKLIGGDKAFAGNTPDQVTEVVTALRVHELQLVEDRGAISKKLWDASVKSYGTYDVENFDVDAPTNAYDKAVDPSLLEEARS